MGSVIDKVVVTGATGFLGRNVLAALAARSDVEPIAACRTPDKLTPTFAGEVRQGDLRDAGYRRALVQDVDVICHTGTWGAFWGHEAQERTHFFEPALDLIEQAVMAGVGRFLLAGSVVVAAPGRDGSPVDDFAPAVSSGFWPHLDRLIELEALMQAKRGHGTQMVSMRLGHFVGAGNEQGIVPALVPRLRTRLVPWLAGGRARLPLVGGSDLGEGFALAATAPADRLDDYESFNICGPEYPTSREVIEFICTETDVPLPSVSAPYGAGNAFGWLMEKLHPVLPGAAPFLTRSIVHTARDWYCPTDYASRKLGYRPSTNWRAAVRESVAERTALGTPWPRLAQEVR